MQLRLRDNLPPERMWFDRKGWFVFYGGEHVVHVVVQLLVLLFYPGKLCTNGAGFPPSPVGLQHFMG